MQGEYRTHEEREGLYKVNPVGSVLSIPRLVDMGIAGKRISSYRQLKLKAWTHGYYAVSLHFPSGKKKKMLVHRMVAMCFVPNPNGYKFVNHINGIKTDNRAENLEWCTHQHNMQHAVDTGLWVQARGSKSGAAVINEETAAKIKLLIKEYMPMTEIAKHFGIKIGVVNAIKANRTWRHVSI